MFRIDATTGPWRRALLAAIAGGFALLPQAHSADVRPRPPMQMPNSPGDATTRELSRVTSNPVDTRPKQSVAVQKSFPTPEAAAGALVEAARARDSAALLQVLGPEGKPLLSSGDAAADAAALERFVKSWDESNKMEKSSDAKAVIVTGKDAWPFPVPLVKSGDSWKFDTKAGKEEILNRRIGRNELSTIKALLAYVDAQREFYDRNPAGDKLPHFADRFISEQGRKNGLYWPTKETEVPSPLGPLFDSAKAAGYAKAEAGKPVPYFGYHYRILKSQGSDAKGGAYGYVAQGRMIGGHAAIAWPATYGNSGVMTFMVSHDGVVYEKDLGPNTAAQAAKITSFNPDGTWKQAKEGI